MMGNSNSKMTDKSREEELMECVHNNTPEEEIDECLSNMDGDKAERSEGGEKESEPDHMMGPQGVSAFMPPEGCESVEGQDDSANMDCPQNNEGKHDGNVGNSSPHESMEVEEKSDTSKTESVEGQDDSANMDCPQKNEGKDDGNVGNSSPHESMEVEEKSEEKSMKEDSNGGEKEEKNEEIKSDLEPTNEARGEEKRGNVGDNTNPQRIDTEEMAAGNMSDEEDCAITPAEKNKNKGDNNGGEKEKTEENWDDTPTPAQPQKDYPKYVIPARKNGSPEAANSSEKNGAQQNGRAARPTSLDIPAANAFCFPANAPAQAVPVPKQRKHSNMLINIPQRPAKSISISHEAAEIAIKNDVRFKYYRRMNPFICSCCLGYLNPIFSSSMAHVDARCCFCRNVISLRNSTHTTKCMEKHGARLCRCSISCCMLRHLSYEYFKKHYQYA